MRVAVLLTLALVTSACDRDDRHATPARAPARDPAPGSPPGERCGPLRRDQLDERIIPRLRKAVPTRGIFWAYGERGTTGPLEARVVVDLDRQVMFARPLQPIGATQDAVRPLTAAQSQKLVALAAALHGAKCPLLTAATETSHTLVIANGDEVFEIQGGGLAIEPAAAAALVAALTSFASQL